MTTPINLNKARKQRARAEKARQADENRLRHGRTKSEKRTDQAQAKRQETALDAHRRDTD